MTIQHGQEYNQFLQLLEEKAKDGFFFYYIGQCIYVTDYEYKLLGIWDRGEHKAKVIS